MSRFKFANTGALLLAAALLGGCAAQRPAVDYSEFRSARPASILVLPPVNSSPDVKATYSVLSQVTMPLAESGYYVFPVALVDETFRQNGFTVPTDIQQIPAAKLREIFGADAALYIEVKQYGTQYAVVVSETRVTAAGRLVDLRTGKLLWSGTATASNNEGNNNSGGGLIGMLITAAIKQIVNTVSEQGHPIAGVTDQRLLSAGSPNGILYGPRSPKYLKEGQPTP
jgi:hypothetical protein